MYLRFYANTLEIIQKHKGEISVVSDLVYTSYLAQLMKVEVLLKEYSWNDATQEI